jgi:ionotropic glutamate receptor NMDA 2B
MLLMLLVVTMVTTLGSSLGVTAEVATATNLSSSMSAWRSSSSGGTHHHGDKKHKEGNVTVGLILPHTNFGVREYLRSVKEAVEKLTKSRGPKLNFLKKFEFSNKQVHSVMMTLTPSPTGKYTKYYDRIISCNSSSTMAGLQITELIVIGAISS